MADDLTNHLTDENYIAQHLSRNPQAQLTWIQEWPAWLFTKFKRLGVFGWTKTSCSAGGLGKIIQIAHSTDGFYTMDVSIVGINIACNHGKYVGMATLNHPNRYIRLEIEPDTLAHETCENFPFSEGQSIFFQGPILIDADGPFYEVHPTRVWAGPTF